MSTQIKYTVENLHTKKLITKHRITGKETAQVWVGEQHSLHLFIVDDRYEVTLADVKDAIKCQPKPDYLVHSIWQKLTYAAEEEAKQHQLKVISFGKLCFILEEMAESEEDPS